MIGWENKVRAWRSHPPVHTSRIFGDATEAVSRSTLRTITIACEVAGQITSVTDPPVTTSYTYDDLGRAARLRQQIAAFTPTAMLSQAIEVFSNGTASTSIGSTLDFSDTYAYNTLHRLTDVSTHGQSGGNGVQVKTASRSVEIHFLSRSEFSII